MYHFAIKIVIIIITKRTIWYEVKEKDHRNFHCKNKYNKKGNLIQVKGFSFSLMDNYCYNDENNKMDIGDNLEVWIHIQNNILNSEIKKNYVLYKW